MLIRSFRRRIRKKEVEREIFRSVLGEDWIGFRRRIRKKEVERWIETLFRYWTIVVSEGESVKRRLKAQDPDYAYRC